jgi:putative ABC transport system substrate-binding protein
MKALGYVEGRNVVYLTRRSDLDMTRRAALIDELIAEKPDVFVGFESEALAMRARTSTIPIVLNGSIDPVGAGLARSLGRPGFNVTGVAQLNDVLPQKHIELLIAILPQVQRVALLFDKGAAGCRLVHRNAGLAAQHFGRSLVVYEIANKTDIERAFLQMENDRPDALLPCPSFVLANHRELLFAESLRMRIPLSSFIVANVPRGVLFAYSSSRDEEVKKAANYVDRILRGANPAELPIEQPTRFELVINLQTAKALGIRVPPSILLRADRIVE